MEQEKLFALVKHRFSRSIQWANGYVAGVQNEDMSRKARMADVKRTDNYGEGFRQGFVDARGEDVFLDNQWAVEGQMTLAPDDWKWWLDED